MTSQQCYVDQVGQRVLEGRLLSAEKFAQSDIEGIQAYAHRTFYFAHDRILFISPREICTHRLFLSPYFNMTKFVECSPISLSAAKQ